MVTLLVVMLAAVPKKCATACYEYPNANVCVYRESETCEAWEQECRPDLNCVPQTVKVTDVDVVILEPYYPGQPKLKFVTR